MNQPPSGPLNDGGPANVVHVVFNPGQADLFRGDTVPPDAPARRYLTTGMSLRDTLAMNFASAILTNAQFDGDEDKAKEIVGKTGFVLADEFIVSKQTQLAAAVKSAAVQAQLTESVEIARRSTTSGVVNAAGQAEGLKFHK